MFINVICTWNKVNNIQTPAKKSGGKKEEIARNILVGDNIIYFSSWHFKWMNNKLENWIH